MKKIFIGFIVGYIVGSVICVAVASNIGGEALWNRVYNSTLQTINIAGE